MHSSDPFSPLADGLG
jgi:hypothetical protein